MAAGDYTDLATLHTYLDIATGSTGQDALLSMFITTCSRMFDRETNRATRFWQAQTGVTRYYNGSGTSWMDIDDFDVITDVTMCALQDRSDLVHMSLTNAASSYFIEVYPLADKGPPYNQLYYRQTWLPDTYAIGNVSVTGNATMQAEIQTAVTIWAAYLYKARNAGFSDETARANNGGQAKYAGGIPEQTQIVIDYYRAEADRNPTASPRMSPMTGYQLEGYIWPDQQA